MPVSSESLFQLLREKGIYGFFDFLARWLNPPINGPVFMEKKQNAIKQYVFMLPSGIMNYTG